MTKRSSRLSNHRFGRARLVVLVGGLGLVLAALPTFAIPSPAGAAGVPHVAARPSPGCAQTTAVTAEQTLTFDADKDDGTYVEQLPTTAEPRKPLPCHLRPPRLSRSPGPAPGDAVGPRRPTGRPRVS
jgi:hypothetical protein